MKVASVKPSLKKSDVITTNRAKDQKKLTTMLSRSDKHLIGTHESQNTDNSIDSWDVYDTNDVRY